MWAFIKTVESDVKVLWKVTWGQTENIQSDVWHSINYLDPCGAVTLYCRTYAIGQIKGLPQLVLLQQSEVVSWLDIRMSNK